MKFTDTVGVDILDTIKDKLKSDVLKNVEEDVWRDGYRQGRRTGIAYSAIGVALFVLLRNVLEEKRKS